MAKLKITVTAALVALPIQVQAHSWYPKDCIVTDYCAAVENVAWSVLASEAAPQLIITSGNGRAVVQRNFPVHDSKDGRLHVCMRYDSFGDLEVTCLLVPTRGL